MPETSENPKNSQDEFWMRKALEAALEARDIDEVPVGACLVSAENELIAIGGNRTITDCDPTAHAEIIALRSGARKIGNYRLTGTTVYTTIEPCVMCAGAIVNARISRLVYGTADERFGAVRTKFRLCDSSSLNHQVEITAGVMEAQCRAIMQSFFRVKRLKIGE
jgi:tRNA(adenine34) deaminase